MGEVKTSGAAIAALVLGIIAFLIGWIPIIGWLFVLLGFIFGIIGIKKTKGGVAKGRGMAITGLVLSSIQLIGIILLVPLMMIGGLAYFGTLDPSNLVPDSCVAGDGFTCVASRANPGSTDVVQLNVVNSLDSYVIADLSDITLTSVGVNGCTKLDGELSEVVGVTDIFVNGNPIQSSSVSVEKGDDLLLNLDCAEGELISGERIQGYVDIEYVVEGKELPRVTAIDFSLTAE